MGSDDAAVVGERVEPSRRVHHAPIGTVGDGIVRPELVAVRTIGRTPLREHAESIPAQKIRLQPFRRLGQGQGAGLRERRDCEESVQRIVWTLHTRLRVRRIAPPPDSGVIEHVVYRLPHAFALLRARPRKLLPGAEALVVDGIVDEREVVQLLVDREGIVGEEAVSAHQRLPGLRRRLRPLDELSAERQVLRLGRRVPGGVEVVVEEDDV